MTPSDTAPRLNTLLKPKGTIGCTFKSCFLLSFVSLLIFVTCFVYFPWREDSKKSSLAVSGAVRAKSFIYVKKGSSLKKVGYLPEGTEVSGENLGHWIEVSNVQVLDLETHEPIDLSKIPPTLYIDANDFIDRYELLLRKSMSGE